MSCEKEYRMDIVIYRDKCQGCGECVEECPLFALSLVDGIARHSRDKCGACGMCLDVCPHGAMEMLH